MPSPRYYIIDEDGDVFSTNSRDDAIRAQDDGISIMIDSFLGSYFYDNSELPITAYQPVDDEPDEDVDGEGSDE